MAQDRYHQAVAFFFLIYLIRDKLHEFFLFCIKHDRIDHPAVYDHAVKRPVDKIRHAKLIRPLHIRI
jgi:hypothetical protein